MSTFVGTKRYRVLHQLGAGAYGVVYAVRDLDREQDVAAKVLNRLDPQDLYRFKAEFRRFADLRHPNLVRLHELVSEDDCWFFTMELLDGVDWLTYVRPTDQTEATVELGRAQGACDLQRLYETLPQIALGLSALHHEGFVHRDVKPSNIFVTAGGRAVVLDFGMATAARDGNATAHAAGTPLYMAPEQTDVRRITPAADWYALGVMLYQALAGVPPFEGSHALHLLTKKMLERPLSLRERGVDVSPELESLTMALLETDPSSRPSASQILATVRRREPAPEPLESPPPPACIGRDQELLRLREALLESQHRGPKTVLVTSASGLGKSALLQAFLAEAREETLVLAGRCHQRESLPFKAIDPIIDDLTEWLLRASDAEAAAVLPRDVDGLCRLFPVFERVPAVAEAPRRSFANSGSLGSERLRGFDALREMIGRIADRKPVVLAIDDAHWGDEDSARLIAGLLEPPDAPQLLLLLSARPEEIKGSPLLDTLMKARGNATFDERIDLAALKRREARALALHLLGELRSHETSLAKEIAKESGGSPFFIEQLVRHLEESAPDESGRLRLADLLLRRRRSLGESARTLLDLVCVAGAPIDRSTLVAAASLDRSEGEPALDALASAGLLHIAGHDGRRVDVYHDRIRDQITHSISGTRRLEHHLRLAESLVAHEASDSEAIYRHFHAAGDTSRARVFAERAAADAMKGLAFNHAATLYRRAIELADEDDPSRGALSEALALALGASGHGEAAALAFLEASDRTSAPTDALRLRQLAAEQLLASGEVERGFEVLWPVARRLGIRWPRSQVALIAASAFWHFFLRIRGMRYRARPEHETDPIDRLRVDLFLSLGLTLGPSDLIRSGYFSLRAMGEALALGEPRRVARCRMVYESFAAGMDPNKLESAKAKLAGIRDELGADADAMTLAHLGYAEGMSYFVGGYWKDAERVLRRVTRDVGRLEEPPSWLARGAYYYWLIALTLTGGYRELTEQVRKQLRSARERGDRLMETILRLGEPSLVWLSTDDPEAALDHHRTAIERWGSKLGPVQRYLSHQVLVMANLYIGDGARAVAASTPDWNAMRRWFAGIEAMQSGARSVRCRALIGAAQDGGAAAERYTREAERLARAMLRRGRAWSDALAYPVLAAVAHRRGEGARAIAYLEVAVEKATESGLAGYGAASKLYLGVLLADERGEHMANEAIAWMRAEGIVDPWRFARALAPGFPDATRRSGTRELGRNSEAHSLPSALRE